MQIQPYTKDLEPAIKAFNKRLLAGGETHWRFPESHVPTLPKRQNGTPYHELFVCVDGNEVRGGYGLMHTRFVVQGETTPVAHGPQLCLSEGIVNHRYRMIATLQARHALECQPLMYDLTVLSEPVAKLLTTMRWTFLPVPFYFRAVSPSRFLANIAYLRKRRSVGIALDLLRGTGLGTIGIRSAQFRLPTRIEPGSTQVVGQFGPWADAVWEACKAKYSFIATRDSATLNVLYPPSNSRFLRLRISRQSQDLGWVVILDKQMRENKSFGNMRVGWIVDCLAAPEDSYLVARSATRFLDSCGVDVIVTNQSNSAWRKAFLAAGFLRGATNFVLALSPMLAQKLQHLDISKSRIHVTRTDNLADHVSNWTDDDARNNGVTSANVPAA